MKTLLSIGWCLIVVNASAQIGGGGMSRRQVHAQITTNNASAPLGGTLSVTGAVTATAFNLLSTTGTSGSPPGVIYKDGLPFIHNFSYGDNGTVTPYGSNTMVGINAGNLTMGATATDLNESSRNVFVGHSAGENNTLGWDNTFVGMESGRANTSGQKNTFVGHRSGYANTTGYHNAALGYDTAVLNSTGFLGTFLGYTAGHNNTIGERNTFVGAGSGYSNVSGFGNTYIGQNAGYFSVTGASNVTAGYGADVLSSADRNSIVIGSGAVGLGSNTMVLGNNAIATTSIRGTVGIGLDAPDAKLTVKSSGSTTGSAVRVYNSTNSVKFDVLDGGFVGVGKAAVNNYALDAVGMSGAAMFPLYRFRDNRTTAPTTNNWVLSVSRQASDTTCLLFGNDFWHNAAIAANGYPLQLGTDNAGAFSSWLHIATNGAIGINTNSPQAKLHVAASDTNAFAATFPATSPPATNGVHWINFTLNGTNGWLPLYY